MTAEIHVLPIKQHRETPKHIERIIRDLDAHRLKTEIKILAPPRTLDKIIEARIQGKIFLLRRLIDCGKVCKGCPHGPYWYGFYRNKGRFVSFYVGKKLPPRFEAAKLIKIIPEIYGPKEIPAPKKGGDEDGSQK